MASGPPVGTQKSLHLVGDDDDDGNGGTASPTASTTVSRPASRTAQPAQDGLPSGLGHGQRAVRSLTDPVRPSHWHAQGRSRFQGSALNIAVPQNLTFDEPMDMMAEDLPSQGASALWKPPLRFPPTPKTAAATTTTTTTTTPCPPPAGDGVDADLPGDQGSPLDPPDNSSDTLIDALDDASPPPMPCRPKRRSGPRSPAPSMSGRAMRQEIVSASVTTTASATIEPYSLDTPRAAPRLSGDGGYKACVLAPFLFETFFTTRNLSASLHRSSIAIDALASLFALLLSAAQTLPTSFVVRRPSLTTKPFSTLSSWSLISVRRPHLSLSLSPLFIDHHQLPTFLLPSSLITFDNLPPFSMAYRS